MQQIVPVVEHHALRTVKCECLMHKRSLNGQLRSLHDKELSQHRVAELARIQGYAVVEGLRDPRVEEAKCSSRPAEVALHAIGPAGVDDVALEEQLRARNFESMGG